VYEPFVMVLVGPEIGPGTGGGQLMVPAQMLLAAADWHTSLIVHESSSLHAVPGGYHFSTQTMSDEQDQPL